MKYRCKICGYIYDDAKEKVSFADLPDSWKCPVCGAKKSDFEPVEAPQSEAPQSYRAVTEAGAGSASGKTEAAAERGKKQIVIDEDMLKLSPAQLSAICSNLARGCEKQYKARESELYTQLADYFAAATPPKPDRDEADISELLSLDLDMRYPDARAAAEQAEERDRGALRVCTWGEKVTVMLKSLMERYALEGEAFLENTSIWVCTICGCICG